MADHEATLVLARRLARRGVHLDLALAQGRRAHGEAAYWAKSRLAGLTFVEDELPQFEVGDHVRIALGARKGRMGVVVRCHDRGQAFFELKFDNGDLRLVHVSTMEHLSAIEQLARVGK